MKAIISFQNQVLLWNLQQIRLTGLKKVRTVLEYITCLKRKMGMTATIGSV